MNVKEALDIVLESAYNAKYQFSEEFKKLFIPTCFKSAENNKWYYKLDYQNVILFNDEYIEQVNKILVKLKYFKGYNKRKVYYDNYYKYGTFCYYEIDDNKDYTRYIIYLNHKFVIQLQSFKLELSKNTNEIVKLQSVKSIGRDSLININERLRESNVLKENETLTNHLVGTARKYCDILKLCIPNQIGYINNKKAEQIIDNCYKADVSSAFPSQLQKSIPTLKRCKINKIFEPTEDYPFVFIYNRGKKYGQIKILNELDSEIDLQSKFMKDVYYQMLKSTSRTETLSKINLDIEQISIACKKADISLKDVMEEIYNEKLNGSTEEIIKNAKMIMNSFIGYCQLNKKPILSFISAVVIARQNHAMLERCNKLEEDGNQVLYIATDSIVWRGKESLISTDDKFLGSFTNEYKNCRFYGVQVGSYQIEKDGKVKTFCSYLPNNEYKLNLKIGQLERPKNGDRKLWQE